MATAPKKYLPPHRLEKPDWREADRRRGTRQERGYTDAWLHLANSVREEQHYLCQSCLAAGTEHVAIGKLDSRTGKHAKPPVDHIIPVHVRPDLRFERSNLQVLCLSCHARKTAEDVRKYGANRG